jgi:hypothetical protein
MEVALQRTLKRASARGFEYIQSFDDFMSREKDGFYTEEIFHVRTIARNKEWRAQNGLSSYLQGCGED